MRGFSMELWALLCVLMTALALDYQPRYQPELDQLSIENYITSERLFNLHINCLLFDGPCDSVGRWMKPRMASYLLSTCILCTPNQEKEADKFMTWLYEYHPQLFRMAISKYLDANGITLPADSKFKELVEQMNVPKVESHETSGGTLNSQQKQLHQEQEQPGTHPQSQNAQQSFHQNSPPQHQHQQQSQSQPNEYSQTQHQTFGNQRILNPNSRKHKFSTGMNTFSGVAQPSSISIEDDEAELEVTTDH